MLTTMWEAARVYAENKVPWRERGRSSEGVDCLGLVIACSRDIGHDLDPDNELYREMNVGTITRVFAINGAYRVGLDNAQPGDIVYFGDRNITIMGILSPGEPLNVVHTPHKNPVVERTFDLRLGRLRGVIRLKGV